MSTETNVKLPGNKKIYFASDFHLGVPDHEGSLQREKKLVRWLEDIQEDAHEIYLMGDVFDFWFEYKTVVPKGFVRLLGKLAEITDSGIPVYLFRGNHDIWAFDYLEQELNLILYRKSVMKSFNGKRFFLAHGDGLGPGDRGYKFLKKVFEAQLNQWLFRWIHPDIGSRLALYFSKKSRLANEIREGKRLAVDQDPEGERLFHFANTMLRKHPEINYFIFGHRHKPYHTKIDKHTEFLTLGDWITNFTYAVFDGEKISLKHYE
ncbi:MAG: UDP-2,3-diacylglucosamine diphosphatase [Bacteroidales bacterium]|nr:UDP-2,3-diacylglucosamine diphosphatase [Bacteroidales bacterium]